MAVLNVVDDFYLRDVWAAELAGWGVAPLPEPTAPAAGVAPPRDTLLGRCEWPILSRGRRARQSSVYLHGAAAWKQEDASAAVGGRINGEAKFHTEYEDFPWWEVDLGRVAGVREIHVYNVWNQTAPRCRRLQINVSLDGVTWMMLVRKTDESVVGGLRGNRFEWAGAPVAARLVRVTLLARDYFHLDQVEVFGD
jgi:hypothetical protein